MSLTAGQLSNVGEVATRPINIMSIEHSGSEELLSCSGDLSYDGDTYTGGGVNIQRIENTRSATLTMPATATRITESQNGTWRGGTCKIYSIPALPTDSNIFAAADGVMVLDGVILTSSFVQDKIKLTIVHINLDGNYTPRNLIDEACNHVPSPGTILSWEGENIVLVSRR
jgi:hypothetical protein